MSKRDELRIFMIAGGYMEQSRAMFDMAIDAAKEETIAEVRAELDARLEPSGKPHGGASGTPAPSRESITVSSEMAEIAAAEAWIDGRHYVMAGDPPAGSREVALYAVDDAPKPEPVPCQKPLVWCKGCGQPVHRRLAYNTTDGKTVCAWCGIVADFFTPYTGGPSPSPEPAPAAEPTSSKPAPGGLEVGRLADALRSIRDTIRTLAASDGVVLNRVREIADRALYLPVPNDYIIPRDVHRILDLPESEYISLIDDLAQVKKLRDALREIRDDGLETDQTWRSLAMKLRHIAGRALDE